MSSRSSAPRLTTRTISDEQSSTVLSRSSFVGPAMIATSASGRSSRSSLAPAYEREPEMFADVAASGPVASSIAQHAALSGHRKAIVGPWRAAAAYRSALRSTMIVTGPGQNRSMTARAPGESRAANPSASAGRLKWMASGFCDGRRFAAKIASIAVSSSGAQPIPYTVSVGNISVPPRATHEAASARAAASGTPPVRWIFKPNLALGGLRREGLRRQDANPMVRI